MTVEALDHVNIRTDDVSGTAAFFSDVLGLSARPASRASSLADGAWLYDERDHPVIHVGTSKSRYPTDGGGAGFSVPVTGPIHHVAFNCTDYDAMRGHIETLGHRFFENDVPSVGLRQLFVLAPGGVLLELNFRNGAISAP